MPAVTERDELVTLWQGRIETAMRYLDRYGDQGGRWTSNVKASAGDFNSKAKFGDEAVDVNMTRSTLDTILPPLYVNEPRIIATPTKSRQALANGQEFDPVFGSEVTEVEINYWLRELRVKRVIKQAVVDCETTNLGYAYVGYVNDKKDVELDGKRHEPLLHIRPKRPFVKRLSPREVLVPPGVYDLEDALWIGIVFQKPTTWARERYENEDIPTTKRLWDETSPDGARVDDPPSEQLRGYIDSDDNAITEIIEIWDKESMKVLTFARDHDEVLDERGWPKAIEGFPVVAMRFIDVSDEYFGTPPMSYYLPQNLELNKARSRTSVRENRTKSVIFMDDNMAEEVSTAYADADDGEIIRVALEGEDIRSKMMIDPGLPPSGSSYAYGDVQLSDLMFVSGMGMQQRGQGDPNAPTATSSANIEKWMIVRQTNKGDVVRDFILGIVRRLWVILKTNPNEKRDRLVQGDRPGVFRRLRYTTEDLQGEYAFDLDVSAMLSDNPATRVTRAIGNYNLLRADPLVNPQKLLIDILRAQNTQNPESYLMDLKDPQEEFQIFLSGVPVEAHERDDHAAHVRAHEVQAAKLEAMLEQVQDEAQSMKVKLAMALVMAHQNHHAMLMEQIASSRPGKQPGEPQAENVMRAQAAQAGVGETEAELSGQPQGGETAQTPGGIEVQ